MSSALTLMAWREIFARVMDGFELQENVSPDWLVNPATRRRLKLDLLYPEAGLAVRFVGLTAKGQGRKDDWTLQEEEQRDQTRAELCRANGVELFLVDLDNADPQRQLQELRTVLSRLSRQTAQGWQTHTSKVALMPRLAEARKQLDAVARRVRQPENLAIFVELWRDRELATLAATRELPSTQQKKKAARPRQYQVGQAVVHERFGPGVVAALNGSAGDPQITIEFQDGSQRTFLASLAAGKLDAA